MRLVVLIDNCTINGRNLKGEGGASYYIEDEDKKLLLDAGASGLFMENAKNLDINLDDIDTVVLSHGHYDHAGGLRDFIESRDDKINIICHPLSFNKKKKENCLFFFMKFNIFCITLTLSHSFVFLGLQKYKTYLPVN